MTKNPRTAKPTKADKQAAERLATHWRAAKARGVTQEDAARALKITQPAVSQYLRGAIPLGFEALMKWAEFLGVDAREIRDDLPEQRHIAAAQSTSTAQDEIAENDRTALHLAIGSLITSLVANMPGVAQDFAAVLRERAEHMKFSTETAGLVKEVLRTVELGQRTAANAVRRASPPAAAHKAK